MNRRPTARAHGRVRAAAIATGGSPPPATPTLTAPAGNVAVFNNVAVTLSATTTDVDLDRMEWVLDGSTIVASDLTSPYSTSWTPTGVSDGDHTLQARAVRAGQTTTSASITVNVGEVLHTLVSSVTCLRAWQSDFQASVSAWVDQKNGVSALQGTGANQPTIVSNALGLHQAVRFDGSNDFMRDATLDLAQPTTTTTFVWGVFTPISWTTSDIVWCAGTTAGQVQLAQSGSTPQMIAYDGTVSAVNAGAAIGTPTRAEQRHSGVAGDYLKLGSTTVTGSMGNLDPPAGWNIGALSNGTNAGNFDVYACIIFSGVPSGAELAALSAAAAAMYPGLAT